MAWTAGDVMHTALVGDDGSVRPAATIDGYLQALEGTGDGWLLAFERDFAIHLARINAAGEVVATHATGLGENDLAMARGPSSVLLFTGREAVLATFDGEVERRVDVGSGFSPAVASTATTFLAVWRDGSTIYARALNQRARLRSEPVILGTSNSEPSVATDGSNFLVTWLAVSGDPTTAGGAIEGRIVGPDVQPVTGVTTFTRSASTSAHVTLWDSGRYRIYFTRDGEDWLVDVDVAGRPGTPRPDVDRTRRLHEVVRIEHATCGEGSAVVATLPGLGPVIVSVGPPVRDVPAVTTTSRGVATAFYERSDISSHRLRLPSGVVVTLSEHLFPFRVPPAFASDGTNTEDLDLRPSIAASGTGFLVVISQQVLRIAPDGSSARIATLPEGAMRAVITATRDRAHVAYVLGTEVFVREIELAAPRRRAVRHAPH